MSSIIPHILMCLLLFCMSCSSTTVTVHRHVSTVKPGTGMFMVGAAEEELTAMPGYPLGGFGSMANISLGIWTHLYASAVYVEDPGGQYMILVSCDLWAMPAGLADKVAETVARTAGCEHIGRDRIIFAATHTHASQANFSSSRVYNTLASHGIGFDPNLFDIMHRRIALAIERAYKKRQAAELWTQTVLVEGLTRNRSYEAFKENPEHQHILAENSTPYTEVIHPYPKESVKGVNPKLEIVTAVRAGNKKPIAVMVHFPMHQNILGNAAAVYSADVFGVAKLHLKSFLTNVPTANDSAIVAFFNGEEGDVAGNWDAQSHRTVEKLGFLLADKVIDGMQKMQLADSNRINGPISVRFMQIPFNAQVVAEEGHLCGYEESTFATAYEPDIGFGAMGGSEDGKTDMKAFNEGDRLIACRLNAQGQKLGVRNIFFKKNRKYKYIDPETATKPNLPFTQEESPDITEMQIALKKNDRRTIGNLLRRAYTDGKQHEEETAEDKGLLEDLTKGFESAVAIADPQLITSAPVAVYTLGPVCYITLPGEFTTTAGRRIRHAVSERLPVKKGIIIGLANEYLSYFAAPPEYQKQHYEGAFTLYGEASVPYIIRKLQAMLDSATIPGRDTSITYKCGSIRVFGREELINETNTSVAETAIHAFTNASGAVLQKKELPKFDLDIIDNDLFDRVLVDSLTVPVISILREYNGVCCDTLTEILAFPSSGVALTQQLTNYSSTGLLCLIHPADEYFRWRVYWLNRNKFPKDGIYRFHVKYNGKPPIRSKAFTLTDNFATPIQRE